jgi:lipopolysaccharide export system protein LptA
MNSSTSPLRATAFLGISLLTQSLLAAPPQPLTAGEIAAIQDAAASKAAAATAANAAAHASLDRDLAAAATASKAAAAFLVQTDLPPAAASAEPAAARPLDITPAATATVINCEGGMYFDADEGVLVYLKNVTVKDPRFDLSGANELKIFFEKKPAKVAKKDETNAPENPKSDKGKAGFGGAVGGNFGDVERIVATGVVKLEQKAAAGKEPIKASAAIFTYNLKADQIILSGGYPWFTQGTTYMRAKEPNLILRLSPKTGSFITEGNWEMGGNLEQKK